MVIVLKTMLNIKTSIIMILESFIGNQEIFHGKFNFY